jgi:hypothetical protein
VCLGGGGVDESELRARINLARFAAYGHRDCARIMTSTMRVAAACKVRVIG